jgi:hypothetical protein
MENMTMPEAALANMILMFRQIADLPSLNAAKPALRTIRGLIGLLEGQGHDCTDIWEYYRQSVAGLSARQSEG